MAKMAAKSKLSIKISLKINSAGLSNYNVPCIIHIKNNFFLHCKLKNDQ